jgi:hypothetical protein
LGKGRLVVVSEGDEVKVIGTSGPAIEFATRLEHCMTGSHSARSPQSSVFDGLLP